MSTSPPVKLDVISRTALRYTLSPREYDLLQKYFLSRLPRSVTKRVPRYPPTTADNDDTLSALRTSLRILLSTYFSLRTFDALLPLLTKSPHTAAPPSSKPPYRIARISISLSMLLFLHRVLYRFLSRLRIALLSPEAKGFRKRNPRAFRVLGSRVAPVVGSSLAGAALGIWPSGAGRRALAVWMVNRILNATRAPEQRQIYLDLLRFAAKHPAAPEAVRHEARHFIEHQRGANA